MSAQLLACIVWKLPTSPKAEGQPALLGGRVGFSPPPPPKCLLIPSLPPSLLFALLQCELGRAL